MGLQRTGSPCARNDTIGTSQKNQALSRKTETANRSFGATSIKRAIFGKFFNTEKPQRAKRIRLILAYPTSSS